MHNRLDIHFISEQSKNFIYSEWMKKISRLKHLMTKLAIWISLQKTEVKIFVVKFVLLSNKWEFVQKVRIMKKDRGKMKLIFAIPMHLLLPIMQ